MLDAIEQIGAFAGLAAFLGLAVLALLSFTQGRDIRRLREWAGSAPERDAERKEATSTVAAQRAEELRALEEARTAEQEAINEREQRRRRREEGLPEESTGERITEGVSRFGDRFADARWLAAIFVVLVLVAAGVAYALLSGGDSESASGNGNGGGQQQQQQTASTQMKPAEIEVTVLNGTAVAGLAATYGDLVEEKGFGLGAVSNTTLPVEASVVMFTRGHKPEAQMVSQRLGIGEVQLMSPEVEAVAEGADIAVIVGEDNAAEAG